MEMCKLQNIKLGVKDLKTNGHNALSAHARTHSAAASDNTGAANSVTEKVFPNQEHIKRQVQRNMQVPCRRLLGAC
eukprot:g30501.t1